MAKTVEIKLSDPIEGHHGRMIDRVVMRPPLYGEYLEHGDPVNYGVSPEGTTFAIENKDAIKAYSELLIVEPSDPLLLRQASFRVARQVKKQIFDFFHGGNEGGEASAAASPTSPTSSSSEGSPPSPQTLSLE